MCLFRKQVNKQIQIYFACIIYFVTATFYYLFGPTLWARFVMSYNVDIFNHCGYLNIFKEIFS